MLRGMKSIKHPALVAALALIAGCATTFRPWKLSEIEEGVDRAAVVRILGAPDSVETKNGAEFLYYSYSEDYDPPPAKDSIHAYDTTRKFHNRQAKQSFRKYRYAVKLVDGKVQNYKELED